MNLIEILFQKSELEKLLEDTTGELTPELEEQIKQIDVLEKGKVDALAGVFERIAVNSERIEKRIEEYSKAVKTLTTVEKRIKEHIKASMLASGQSRIEGDDHYFLVSKLKDKIIIDDPDQVPQYFKKTKILIENDLEAIRESIKDNIPVEGVRTEENYSLRKYIKKGV